MGTLYVGRRIRARYMHDRWRCLVSCRHSLLSWRVACVSLGSVPLLPINSGHSHTAVQCTVARCCGNLTPGTNFRPLCMTLSHCMSQTELLERKAFLSESKQVLLGANDVLDGQKTKEKMAYDDRTVSVASPRQCFAVGPCRLPCPGVSFDSTWASVLVCRARTPLSVANIDSCYYCYCCC